MVVYLFLVVRREMCEVIRSKSECFTHEESVLKSASGDCATVCLKLFGRN